MAHPEDSDAPEREGLPESFLRKIAAAPELPIPPTIEAGTIIGDSFLVAKRLGEGGMGVVYKARDVALHRDVAIKLHHVIAAPATLDRLSLEAKALARLSHPNVLQVHEVGTFEKRLFVVMELASGGSLRDWLADEQRSPREIISAFVDAGRGLAATHEAGFVHRDIKPDNILIGDDGRVRVADFGLARLATTDEQDSASAPAPPWQAGLTATGAFLGTPAYMAPEQFRGSEVDHRADQFAFCVALYEALYGERPFRGTNRGEILASIDRGPQPEPPGTGKAPRRVHRILVRGLSARPEDRYPSMAALAEDLDTDPAAIRRRWLLAIALLGLLALVAVSSISQLRANAGPPSCDGAGDDLALDWDTRAEEVRRSFRASARPHANHALSSVQSAMVEYDRALKARGSAACRDAREHGMQSESALDRRMACLRRARGYANALVEVLATADATAVDHAVAAVATLAPLERCGNTELLLAQALPPSAATLAAEVSALDQEVLRAAALSEAGAIARAAEVLAPALERARETPYAPLLAEALLVSGSIAQRRGQAQVAEQHLEQAFLTAQRSGHDRVAVEAASRLVALFGRDQNRFVHANFWAHLASVEVDRRWRDTAMEGTVLLRHAAYLEARGDHDQALEGRRRAVQILRSAGHKLHLANALVAVGSSLEAQGSPDEAASHRAEAYALLRVLLGPDHPLGRSPSVTPQQPPVIPDAVDPILPEVR